MTDPEVTPALNPTQQRTLDLLRRPPTPTVFDRAAIDHLIDEVNDALEMFTHRLEAVGVDSLFVNKTFISSILGCEDHHLHRAKFVPNIATTTGTVAHRAIELLIGWRGEPLPSVLVDEAIARLSEKPNDLGDFLAGLSDADRADLTNAATDRVVKFTESFPPLSQRFIPVAESSIRWPEAGGIILGGKSDLTLGRAENGESRKVIIDLKTGGSWPNHADDLRFYALVDTLRTGIPPRLIASFYLDAGRAVPETVTTETLRAAIRRTFDAIHRAVELAEGQSPQRLPQASCRWCPLIAECAEGSAWLAEQRGDDD